MTEIDLNFFSMMTVIGVPVKVGILKSDFNEIGTAVSFVFLTDSKYMHL